MGLARVSRLLLGTGLAAACVAATAADTPRWAALGSATQTDWQRAFVFEEIGAPSGNGMIPVKRHGRWGYLNASGRWAIPPRFEYAAPFTEDVAAVQFNGKSGYITPEGLWAIPPVFLSASSFSSGTAQVSVNGPDNRPAYHRIGHDGKPRKDQATALSAGKPAAPGNYITYQAHPDGHIQAEWYEGEQRRYGLLDANGQRLTLPTPDGGFNGYLGEGVVTWAKESGKTSLIEIKTGKVLVSGISDVQGFTHGLAPARAKGGWGMLRRDGSWAVPPRHEQVFILSGELAAVRQNGLWGWVDMNGKTVVAPRFNQLFPMKNGLAVAGETCRLGVVNARGEWVIAPEFDNITPGGVFWLVTRDGRQGVLDASGHWLTPPPPNSATAWPGGGDGWGFVDTAGREVIPAVFGEASDFSHGSAALSPRYGAAGIIAPNGQWLLPPVFVRTWPFEGNVATVNSYDGIVQVDRHCRVVKRHIEPENTLIEFSPGNTYSSDASEGLQRMALNGRWGYVDKNGAWLIKPRFDDAGRFSGGLAPVQTGGQWGYIDKRGGLVIAARFDEADNFSEGRAKVREGNDWFFIDTTGKEIPETGFQAAGRFSQGLAPVQRNDAWGYINRRGEFVVPPRYAEAHEFHDGLARVRSSQPRKLTAPPATGNILSATATTEGFATLQWYSGHWAVMNRRGEILIPTSLPASP